MAAISLFASPSILLNTKISLHFSGSIICVILKIEEL